MYKIIGFLLIFSAFLSAVPAVAGEYHVDKNQENMVKFISDAPVENFEGVTDQVDGYLFWEGDDITNKSALYFEVDLNSLDTGIGLRNRHMRENYLETGLYPRTSFKGQIKQSELGTGDTLKVNAEGTIFIHGIEKPISVDARLVPKGKGYQIMSRFFVKLSDFKVDIPSIMFYKIDENMDLRLNFYVKQVSGAE